ncbi:MAG: hypothetical protein SGI86_08000 [Deltaproteobacteria bacterium]|nr:hypothetical protein [Deltaproteobacteria bacterium]
MQDPVEVVAFYRGERQNARVLSTHRELRAGVTAVALTAGFSVLAMGAFVGLATAARFVLHTPVFAAAWGVSTALACGIAYRRARKRVGRFALGASMESDAFGEWEFDLVRRMRGAGNGYELALAPGMRGTLYEGDAKRPIEGLTSHTDLRYVPLESGTRAIIDLPAATFSVRCGPIEEKSEKLPLLAAVKVPGLGPRQFVALGMRFVPLAMLVSFFTASSSPVALLDADLVSAIDPNLTPHAVELQLRKQAQLQAQTLHDCFEPLPLSCHRAGYVGVGLKLAKNGAVERSWIARSSFGEECPVTACMQTVVSGWFFDAIPDPMSLIVPVQVLRTRKPMPSTQRPVELAESTPCDATVAAWRARGCATAPVLFDGL